MALNDRSDHLGLNTFVEGKLAAANLPIEGAVHGGEMGHRQPRHQGVMGRAGMEMQDVEAIPQIGHHIHLNEFRHQRVSAITGLPKGFGHRCKELCTCAGVAAGKEHHVVTAAHQFFREVVHNPLRSPIAARWHALRQRGNLTDSHCSSTDWIPPMKISAVTSGLVRLNSAGLTWSDLGRRRRSDLAGGGHHQEAHSF